MLSVVLSNAYHEYANINKKRAAADYKENLNGKKTIRIRKIQRYNDSVEKAILGSRVALNLSGIKKEEVRRGDLISGLKALPSGNFLDVSFALLSRENPFRLKNGTEVEFISHTKILRGTIIFSQKKFFSGEKLMSSFPFKKRICP